MTNNSLIGLSLSRCIADICTGKIRVDQVAVIVAATKAEDLRDLIPLYCAPFNPWSKFDPRHVEMVLQQLEGRIIQPRLLGLDPHSVAFGWWVDTASGTFHRG